MKKYHVTVRYKIPMTALYTVNAKTKKEAKEKFKAFIDGDCIRSFEKDIVDECMAEEIVCFDKMVIDNIKEIEDAIQDRQEDHSEGC